MKTICVLFLCLVLAGVGLSQVKNDYSGEWTLDFAQSNILPQGSPVAFSKTIVQSENKIEILNDAIIKKVFPDSQIQMFVYSLDGKPNTLTYNFGINQNQITLQANFGTDNNLKIRRTQQSFQNSSPQSETMTNEYWLLSNDTKTLKIAVTVKDADREYSSELTYRKADFTLDKKDGIVNGRAKRLVTPTVSPEAKKAKVEGNIIVEVLIDEKGNVVLAKTIAGHQTMAANSEQAARLCKFSPTKFKDSPVVVTGIIVYTITRN
jgi:hypothetical protein